jgi:hypothetical protein
MTAAPTPLFGVEGVTSSNDITRVWAVIIPPKIASLSSDTPVTDLIQIDLKYNDVNDKFEAEFYQFDQNGTYTVNVYAEDLEGGISLPMQTKVTVEKKSGCFVTNDLWIRAVIHTEDKGDIEGRWHLGGQDNTSRKDRVIWGYFYADPADVSWGNSENPDLFVKIWMDVTGPIYVDYFHVSVPDITVYTDFNAQDTPSADQFYTASLSTRFVEHRFVNGESSFTLQNENGIKPGGGNESADPIGVLLTNSLHIGAMIKTAEKGPIEGVWREGGSGITDRGDTVVWGYYYADPSMVTWGSPQNPDLFVKIWFDVGGMVNVDFFHVSVPDIEVYSELPADGLYDICGTAGLENRFIEHQYVRQ